MAYTETTSQNSNIVNPSGYEVGSSIVEKMNYFYEIEPAIVLDTEFSGSVDKIRAYGLFSKVIVEAMPSNMNLRSNPLPGEIVTFRNHRLLKNPVTVAGNPTPLFSSFYEPLSWNYSVHMNDQGFADLIVASVEDLRKHGIDIEKIKGIPSSINSKVFYVGKYFEYKQESDKRSVMFEGDLIYEGRSGQSIRFGSAIPKKITFGNPNYSQLIPNSKWIYSKSDTVGGNPYIVIGAGKSNISQFYTIEDIQHDPSTILISQGGPNGITLPFLLSAIKNNIPSDVKLPSEYNDNLIILNSDRLIFNSKASDIVLSSYNNLIGLSNKNIYFKTQNTLEVHGSVINLGERAKASGQPVVKGYDMMNFLKSMIDAILSLKYDNYGTLIPGTDTQLRQLKSLLSKKDNSTVFSSKTTFTL